MMNNTWFFITLLVLTLLASWYFKKLTRDGVIAAAVTGCCIFLGMGIGGILLIGAFFLLGTMATSWKKQEKVLLTADAGGSGRNAWQVLANGGIAALCGLFAVCFPHDSTQCLLVLAAAMSAATADTLSSELGTVYGRRFLNILTLKPDKRGENGVISFEGTLIGVAGSIVIAMLYGAITNHWEQLWWIVVAGTVGNCTDSVLGATLERRGTIGNNTVNFFNTMSAALVVGIYFLLR